MNIQIHNSRECIMCSCIHVSLRVPVFIWIWFRYVFTWFRVYQFTYINRTCFILFHSRIHRTHIHVYLYSRKKNETYSYKIVTRVCLFIAVYGVSRLSIQFFLFIPREFTDFRLLSRSLFQRTTTITVRSTIRQYWRFLKIQKKLYF